MSKDLYVKNIALTVTEEELRKLFAVCGKVTYVHMVKDAKSGDFLGCAYVKMSSEAEAKDALVSLDGARLINREIVVSVALPQRSSTQKKPFGTAGARDAAGGGEKRVSSDKQRPVKSGQAKTAGPAAAAGTRPPTKGKKGGPGGGFNRGTKGRG